MSVPASLKVGPFTTLVLVRKRYLIFYVFLICITLFIIQYEFWWYWALLYNNNFIAFVVFLPLLLFIMYITAVIISLIFAKLLLVIVNTVYKPREGVFLRTSESKDYRYWSIRSVIKKFPLWLSHKFPFPFLDNLCLKVFGVKTTFWNSLFEGWCDTEFLEIGKNVVIGQGAIIQSAIIMGNLFIIRKTIIEDNVRIGAHAIVMPGAHIGKNSIFASSSLARVGQILEGGYIYTGAPAKKLKPNVFFEDGLEDIIENQMEIAEKAKSKYVDSYERRQTKRLEKNDTEE